MHSPTVIDLHMHSSISDGTDSPQEILAAVRQAGIRLFSLTDHDAVKGCEMIRQVLTKDDPAFINGIEFSCEDERGKYHILGYHYSLTNAALLQTVETGHQFRLDKLQARLQFLEERFGFVFPQEAKDHLYAQSNPGKPHIANLMVQYGFADSVENAIRNYLNHCHTPNWHLWPKQAIEAILSAGGVPVLAHPSFGSGSQRITGEALDNRLRYLMDFGLQGVEAFYSGFTPQLTDELLTLAKRYDLYVTAGSDYHGANKTVPLGGVQLPAPKDYPPGLCRFLAGVTGE